MASTTGLPSNVAGALAYLLGPLTGILFLVLEKRDGFVRFHAAQSIGVSVVFIVAGVLLGIVTSVLAIVPILGWLVGLALSLGFSLLGLAVWIWLMFRAWQGDRWLAPVIGAKVREMLLAE
ncbi:MAG: hypothetical protein EA350_06820 [Gemmatimonadales bacterium]|nr:MAG: hypothetical protein EA350_06820 [Gemmatimonadales bacterium]